jgi:hypothetical protein
MMLPRFIVRLSGSLRLSLALIIGSIFVSPQLQAQQGVSLTCPRVGSVAVPDLLADSSEASLLVNGNSIDLANEIDALINRLQIEQPNITYDQLTNILIAAYCPVISKAAGLTDSQRWTRMRQFDRLLQQQLAANSTPPATFIVANVPLRPEVFRQLQSQARQRHQTPAEYMASILTQVVAK